MELRAESSEVVVQHLAQLIDRIGSGRLHIPRFQRPPVWSWGRKRELLRSIRDGIPIGSMMIWRTTSERDLVQRSLAGHQLPEPRPNVPREYLLDGLQRLSTLYVALRGPGPQADEDEPGPKIAYDLQQQEFVELDEDEAPSVVPLDVLGSAVALLRVQRTWTGPDAGAWLERSDELARAFREYQVPVVTIVSNDIELATRTFTMLNSQGVHMGEADMVHALAWGDGLAVRERIDDLREDQLVPRGWGEVEDETVLRVVKADADIDLYDRSAEAVSLRIREEPERLDRAVERLALTADILRRRCGVHSWALVPYGLQAGLIAAALAGVEDVRAVEKPIADWLWLTTYGEMFTGISGYRVAQVLDDLGKAMGDGRVRWSGAKPLRLRPLPRRAAWFGARIKALALRLAEAQRSVSSGSTDPFEVLAAHGHHALVSLLTRRQASRPTCSSPGNRFLCPPAELSELRRRISEGDIDATLARAHLIPPVSIAAAEAGQWDRFVSERLAFIEAQERAFVDELCKEHGIVTR